MAFGLKRSWKSRGTARGIKRRTTGRAVRRREGKAYRFGNPQRKGKGKRFV